MLSVTSFFFLVILCHANQCNLLSIVVEHHFSVFVESNVYESFHYRLLAEGKEDGSGQGNRTLPSSQRRAAHPGTWPVGADQEEVQLGLVGGRSAGLSKVLTEHLVLDRKTMDTIIINLSTHAFFVTNS